MRSQLRLKVLLPVIAVAVAGLLFVQFGLDAVGLGSDDDKVAATNGSTNVEANTQEETPAQEPAPAEEPPAVEPAEQVVSESVGMTELRSALQTYGVVVLVVYSPSGNVDSAILSEARLAADEVGAGFVAVNAKKESMIGELALTYEIRQTPSVLVFTQGPELEKRLVGYADRQTVAQAALDAQA